MATPISAGNLTAQSTRTLRRLLGTLCHCLTEKLTVLMELHFIREIETLRQEIAKLTRDRDQLASVDRRREVDAERRAGAKAYDDFEGFFRKQDGFEVRRSSEEREGETVETVTARYGDTCIILTKDREWPHEGLHLWISGALSRDYRLHVLTEFQKRDQVRS